jgi:hypothetical protein
MGEVDVFCRQVRDRSQENRRAISLLHGAALLGQVVGILRQELDSMVRVIYLLSVSDRVRRAQLITAVANGKKWMGEKSGRVTDREMVDLAQRLHGWTGSVYRFGCAFIHLSSYHDYRSRDPILALDAQERTDLLHHMRYYHGGPQTDDFTFFDLGPYLPAVFEKIASNLECYVEKLERDGQLDSHDCPKNDPGSETEREA